VRIDWSRVSKEVNCKPVVCVVMDSDFEWYSYTTSDVEIRINDWGFKGSMFGNHYQFLGYDSELNWSQGTDWKETKTMIYDEQVIVDFGKVGEKIKAIRYHREHMRSSLKKAKETVEAIFEKNGMGYYGITRVPVAEPIPETVVKPSASPIFEFRLDSHGEYCIINGKRFYKEREHKVAVIRHPRKKKNFYFAVTQEFHSNLLNRFVMCDTKIGNKIGYVKSIKTMQEHELIQKGASFPLKSVIAIASHEEIYAEINR